MSTQRKPSPEDLMSAQDIAAYLGLNPVMCESLMRRMGKLGLIETIPGFRRDLVRRKHIEPKFQSGGTT